MVRTLVQSRSQPAFILAFHHQMPWYALNILFVFASVTQLLALHYRLGNRGIFFGGIIPAVIVILLAGSLVVVFSPSSPVDTLLITMIPTLVFPAVVVMLVRDHVSDKVQRFMPRHFFISLMLAIFYWQECFCYECPSGHKGDKYCHILR